MVMPELQRIGKKEHGREPTRDELWLSAHKVKGGDYAPHDKAFAVI